MGIFGESFPLTLKAKSTIDIGQKLDISYTPIGVVADSSFAPTSKNATTFSFQLELLSKIWILDLGAGLGYQTPTSSGDFGDFYFIPAYFLGNVHLYQHKDDFDIYAIYQQGIAFQKGSYPYNTGNLENGTYLGYGLGVKIFSDIHIELMIKNYKSENSAYEHDYYTTDSQGEKTKKTDSYDLDTDYQTLSISIGISNLFDDFLNHLY